jgi:hypothetical protein
MGRDGRLRVALERETPSHSAAAGGKLLLRLQNAATKFAGPANGFRIARAFAYSSQRSRSTQKPKPTEILSHRVRRFQQNFFVYHVDHLGTFRLNPSAIPFHPAGLPA